jgi:co-chaperonin GroES (HSP10)
MLVALTFILKQSPLKASPQNFTRKLTKDKDIKTTEMNFEPTHNYVILPHVKYDKSKAGIILTEQNSIQPSYILEVLAAGPECRSVKVGDTVMVHPESKGLIIPIEGVNYVLINEHMICGRIPNDLAE